MIEIIIGLIFGYFIGLISTTYQVLRMEDKSKRRLKYILDKRKDK